MPQEYVARWTGGRIGAGASVFHFESIASSAAAQGLANAVRAMFASRVSSLSTDVTLEFDTEVRDLAPNGSLVAVYPVTRPADVVGTNTGGYTNGTGLLVRHSTGIIAGGRRLQGRTFIVPVSGADFSTNGDIQLTVQTAWNTAFAGLKTAAAATGANFAVWSRANAIVAPVTISSTLARPSTLRTRNDRV